MRSLITVAFCLCFFACGRQEKITMCHDPNAEFAAFASDEAFKNAHPAPVAVALTHGGKEVAFPVEGGAEGRGYLVTSHAKTNEYLLVFHEWWGLNDNIRQEALRWSHDLGINVLAVDLYDGKVATSPDDAGKLMQANDAERSLAIIRGAAAFAGDNARFRTIGWCFGGGWSLQAALALADRTDKCVMFYGMPETDVEKLKTLNCDVLFVHAQKDKWITDEVVDNFKTAMEEAKRNLTIQSYDADHAFANPSGPRYDDQAAKASRAVAKSFLK